MAKYLGRKVALERRAMGNQSDGKIGSRKKVPIASFQFVAEIVLSLLAMLWRLESIAWGVLNLTSVLVTTVVRHWHRFQGCLRFFQFERWCSTSENQLIELIISGGFLG